jgi:hypothetical protein
LNVPDRLKHCQRRRVCEFSFYPFYYIYMMFD